MGDFSDKRVVISGASRGIGLAIAKRLAADGASIAILPKTAETHPKMPGTEYTAADDIDTAVFRPKTQKNNLPNPSLLLQ